MNFSINPIQYKTFSKYTFRGKTTPQNGVQSVDLTNPNLKKAVFELENLNFSAEDIKQVQQMGVRLPFLNGKDAVDFMNANNIKIAFAQLDSPHIHAQYDDDKKLVLINNLYKDSSSKAEITAIAGATLHELGHAKDKDGYSSIQEEMDNLGMNALADRAFERKYGKLDCESLIVKDGTRVYANLFFDSDTSKHALISRLSQKYGSLPTGGIKHPPTKIALCAKNQRVNS